MRRFVFAALLPITIPAVMLMSAGRNLKDAARFWWLDMRCEFSSIKRIWRSL